MSDFAEHLKASLEATPDLRRRGKRILAIIKGRDSKRRTRILARMEAHTRTHMAALPVAIVGKVDWSAVDWKAIIENVLKLLLALLPLLL